MNAPAPSLESAFMSPPQRLGKALGYLLNNNELHISPPVPELRFHATAGDPPSVCCEGVFSASQYDRLCYLAKAAGLGISLAQAHDHAEPEALSVKVQGGDLSKLEALVTQEPTRRARAKEAEILMQKVTGLTWCWDGFCLTTPYPQQDHPAHSILGDFKSKGVIQNAFDLSVLQGEIVGSKTDWLSIHDCDLVRLRLIGQEMRVPSVSFGR